KNGFLVYLIDEFKTSSICPECERNLIKSKKIENPRLFKQNKMSAITCNGLLKCNNHSLVKI
ncbi:MAG: hypothetical protein EXX96DRAFT_477916, partial [Benjaminiella poitrasii]